MNKLVVDADITKADLISDGDHAGCAFFTNRPAPAVCGEDIDVPLLSPIELAAPARVARMPTPGAVMSGLTKSNAAGPRELNPAITSG